MNFEPSSTVPSHVQGLSEATTSSPSGDMEADDFIEMDDDPMTERLGEPMELWEVVGDFLGPNANLEPIPEFK